MSCRDWNCIQQTITVIAHSFFWLAFLLSQVIWVIQQFCYAMDSLPSKAVPLDYLWQNNRSPGPNIAAIPGPRPLLPMVPPTHLLEVVRRDKTMALCTSVHSIVRTQVPKISYRWSRTAKDNDHEAEVALPISILPRRLIQQERQVSTVWERVSYVTGLLVMSERLQSMHSCFIVDCL